jgi:hypothetical protein
VAYFAIRESLIMTILFVSITCRHLVKGLASEAWMYYLGNYLHIISQDFLDTRNFLLLP